MDLVSHPEMAPPPGFYLIIFINCNWVVTRWQWLFYTYTNKGGGEVTRKFKSGGLHERHVVAFKLFILLVLFPLLLGKLLVCKEFLHYLLKVVTVSGCFLFVNIPTFLPAASVL